MRLLYFILPLLIFFNTSNAQDKFDIEENDTNKH